MYYFGELINTDRVEVFHSRFKPTQGSHGHLYKIVFGGYKSKNEALQWANYQYTGETIVFIDNRKKSQLNDDRFYALNGRH